MTKILLSFTRIRILVSFIRAFWYIKVKKRLNTFKDHSDSIHEHTIFSNLRRVVSNPENPHPNARYLFGIDLQQDGSKVRTLMNPVICIDKISNNISNIKVLIIGPKLESEILSVMSYGIPLRNIKAIDLITYSPWVDQGDMHNLPYQDDTFDLIICGWVIAYSDDKQKAAEEMIRVSKNGCIIAVSATYSPKTNEEIEESRGYLIGSEERIEDTKFLNSLFSKNIGDIYFKHDVPEEAKQDNGKIITIFGIQKPNHV